MPIKPQYEWEQTVDDVLLHIAIKGYKKNAVDVFVSDVFVKVNAAPTYLLTLDLLHSVVVDQCVHYFDSENSFLLHIRLKKADPGLVWKILCVPSDEVSKKEILERRIQSMHKAEENYNLMLKLRAKQRETENRRMTEAQWEVEKEQRRVIENRFNSEKAAAEEDLYAWEDTHKLNGTTTSRATPESPGCILPLTNEHDSAGALSEESQTNDNPPPVRGPSTVNVAIDFTPKMFVLPTRSRGDEEYYRKSRYKPVSIEDSPMFWKEKGDQHYRTHEWRLSADAYSESIKRDGVFLTCVMNRAACFLHMGEYKRAIEDCTLALTLLGNMPASEITQDRYRYLLTTLHARRGAAYCWNDDLVHGVTELRMASAYRDPDGDDDIVKDLQVAEQLMAERGLTIDAAQDPLDSLLQNASSLYYRQDYAAAVEVYREVLAKDPYRVHAHSNLSACLLLLGRFNEVVEECEHIIDFCKEVAAALNQPGILSSDGNDMDSDDENFELGDEEEGEELFMSSGRVETDGDRGKMDHFKGKMVRERRAAAAKLSQNSAHVYLLLKAYVRMAAAHCGLKDYRKSHVFLEQALRITPYDNDLLDDCNRLAEKIRLDTLVAASTTGKVA
ncbi:unnamed protein product [Phytomonas sp. Hart1]|eukprot:CCW67749.1 unnamed protein product [Phytomonas sp. isolate Hart1]